MTDENLADATSKNVQTPGLAEPVSCYRRGLATFFFNKSLPHSAWRLSFSYLVYTSILHGLKKPKVEFSGYRYSFLNIGISACEASEVRWKFVEGECGKIVSRAGNKHSKAWALRALLKPYRHDSRLSFNQNIFNSHH